MGKRFQSCSETIMPFKLSKMEILYIIILKYVTGHELV